MNTHTRIRSGAVPALLLLASTAAAQAPSLSPLQALAGDAAIRAATGDQTQVAIARGGDQYLVAWADRRGRLASNAGASETGLDLWALRLDANGAALDVVPFPIALLPGDDSNPQVTWNGESWLVSWTSQAPFGSIYTSAIVGARVSPAGQVLDSPPITILGEQNALISGHTVAADGSQWVAVVGGSTSGLSGVLAARVSAQGVLLDPVPIQLLPPDQFAGGYVLSHAAGVYLLVWSDWAGDWADDVFGRRFDASLQPLDAAAFPIGSTPLSDSQARVATNGSQFLVSFTRYSSGTYQADVKAVRVPTSGAVLDPVPIAVTGNKPYGVGAAAVAWDGARWYLAWTYGGIELARIAANGTVQDFDGFDFRPGLPVTQSAPVLASARGGGVNMSWTDVRAGSYEGLDVYGSRVVSAGDQGTDVLLSLGAPAQVSADVAGDGSSSILVYRSETSGERRILAARLDPNGAPLDAEPIEISSGLYETHPSIGFDDGVYMVVWERSASLYYRRLAPDGTLLDPAPVYLGVGATPEVAGRSGEFLIVSTRAIAYPLQQFPQVARVRGSDGALLGPLSLIDSNYAVQVDVCALGDRWLVVWQRNYWNNDAHCDIHAAFVEASGAVGAPFWVAGTFNWYNHSVSVAAGGSQALLLWVYGTGSNLTRRLNARRLAADGTFLDPGPITVLSSAPWEQFHPQVAWDGTHYVGVFQDLRATGTIFEQVSDVYGVRMDPGGVVVDPQGFPIEASVVAEVGPVIVPTGLGRSLVASSVFRPEGPFAAFRIGTRTMGSDCPAPSTYCPALPNSTGQPALIAMSGSTSMSANDLTLLCTQLPPNGTAVFFMGPTQIVPGLPLGDGLRCVGPPVVRLGNLAFSGGAAEQLQDLASPRYDGIQPGDLRHFQLWYRDPAGGGAGQNLSDALSITFCN